MKRKKLELLAMVSPLIAMVTATVVFAGVGGVPARVVTGDTGVPITASVTEPSTSTTGSQTPTTPTIGRIDGPACAGPTVTCAPGYTVPPPPPTGPRCDPRFETCGPAVSVGTPPLPEALKVTTTTTHRVVQRRGYPESVTRWHGLALQVGWTERQWKVLQCIIYRESRGYLFPPKHDATGLLQILRSAHPGVDLADPETNLRVGHEMYMASRWSPWYYPRKPCYGEK